jgi:hypothetical protein
MDESKPRRRWLSFGIRDLLWAMVVVGLAIGWWTEKRFSDFERERYEAVCRMLQVTVDDLASCAERDCYRGLPNYGLEFFGTPRQWRRSSEAVPATHN